jgi:signal transduction histidine kinase
MAYAVETLNSLLTSLLDISRLDAGIIVPRLESLPVHDLVDHLTQEYAVQAGAKGLRLVTRIEPAFAVTDLTLLERMIRNLLENAVRYTQEGGILLRLRPHQGRVRLDVVDSGIGISPEQRSAIFDEFFQVANASRDRSQGLGLGLSIVARLCTLIGGEIAVASRVGRGTRFTVWLPAANAPPIKVPSLAAAQTCAGE